MHSTPKPEDAVSPFNLGGSSQNFKSRSNNVFAGLSELEAKHTATVKARSRSRSSDDEGLIKDDPVVEEETKERSHIRSQSDRRRPHSSGFRQGGDRRDDRHRSRSHDDSGDRDLSRHRGSDDPRDRRVDRQGRGGNFTRPAQRPLRQRYVPDFKLHPERWTHHSLNDVTEDDMSDKSNTQAALAFLEERRKEREKQERIEAGLPAEEPKFDVNLGACSQGQISFSKPKSRSNKDSESKRPLKTADTKDEKRTVLTVDAGNDDGEGDIDIDREAECVEKKVSPKETGGFKVKKKVSRHIRRKERDDDSD